MADFYVLLHDDPGDRFSQRRRGQRAVVCPVVIDVGRQQTTWIEPPELYNAVLQADKDRGGRIVANICIFGIYNAEESVNQVRMTLKSIPNLHLADVQAQMFESTSHHSV